MSDSPFPQPVFEHGEWHCPKCGSTSFCIIETGTDVSKAYLGADGAIADTKNVDWSVTKSEFSCWDCDEPLSEVSY